jgi:hypothetical protein
MKARALEGENTYICKKKVKITERSHKWKKGRGRSRRKFEREEGTKDS